jgi:hypothetical protein
MLETLTMLAAVELTLTMLAAPQKLFDGLELGAVKRGRDNLSTMISDETFDLGIRARRPTPS